MAFAYSFGQPEDAWNQKKLNSPLPCPDGIFCSRTICCYNVHPGEEGVKRKYFPGRTTVDRVTGKTITQSPCVRLVGNSKDDVPGYYRRRTAKMSWPAWCAQQNIVVPTPAAAAEPPTAEQLIRQMLPRWSPPSLCSPIFRSSTPIEVLVEHFGMQGTNWEKYILNQYKQVVENQYSDLYTKALYMSVMSLSVRFPPTHPLQQQLRMADVILMRSMHEAHAAEKQKLKQTIGDLIYAKAAHLLKNVEADCRRSGIWVDSFTPGKATGMILESLIGSPSDESVAKLEKEGNALLNNDAEFQELMVECLVAYSAFLQNEAAAQEAIRAVTLPVLPEQALAEAVAEKVLEEPVAEGVRSRVLAMAESMMEYIEEDGRGTGIWRETFTAEVVTEMLMRRGADDMLCEDNELFFQRAVECLIEYSSEADTHKATVYSYTAE